MPAPYSKKVIKIIGLSLLLSLSTLSQFLIAAEITINVKTEREKPVPNMVVIAEPTKPVKLPKESKIIDQVNKEYVPHVILVTKGSQVNFPNKDNIRHHVYSFSEAKQFELPLYEGVPANPIEFEQSGLVTLGCNIHDWMRGYIYVTETPYNGLTDDSGVLRLTNLPADTYTLKFWHPRERQTVESMIVTISELETKSFDIEVNLKRNIKKRKRRKGRYRG